MSFQKAVEDLVKQQHIKKFNFKLLNETLLLDFIHRFHSRADLQLVIDFTQMPFHRIDGQKIDSDISASVQPRLKFSKIWISRFYS